MARTLLPQDYILDVSDLAGMSTNMHLQGSLDYAGQLEVLMHLLLPSISLSGARIPIGGASPRQGELVGLQVAALQALREFILYRCAPHVL